MIVLRIMVLVLMTWTVSCAEIIVREEKPVVDDGITPAPDALAGKSIESTLKYDKVIIRVWARRLKKPDEMKGDIEKIIKQGKIMKDPTLARGKFRGLSGERYEVEFYQGNGLVATAFYEEFTHEGQNWTYTVYGNEVPPTYRYKFDLPDPP